MDICITPTKLSGKIEAVSSKSDAHRALICAALCDERCEIILNSSSRDIVATANTLSTMGASIIKTERGYDVLPIGENAKMGATLDCKESGSTLRFLLPVAAAVLGGASFLGEGRLPERPLTQLIEQMTLHGCEFSGDSIPFTLNGRLSGGAFSLSGDVSSQYVSGLLLALPLIGGGEVSLTSRLQSSAYVDMTIETMSRFGVKVARKKGGFSVGNGESYRSPKKYVVEGDWSNGAFWLVTTFLGSRVAVDGLSFGSCQADRAIADVLERFRQSNDLTLDVSEIPDLAPVLAVAACGRKAKTRFENCARLRLKESDRISSTVNMIAALGGKAEAEDEAIVVYGNGGLDGGNVDGENDHRIVMAAAVASTICKNKVTITSSEAVEKSYPCFFKDFKKLGGRADVV